MINKKIPAKLTGINETIILLYKITKANTTARTNATKIKILNVSADTKKNLFSFIVRVLCVQYIHTKKIIILFQKFNHKILQNLKTDLQFDMQLLDNGCFILKFYIKTNFEYNSFDFAIRMYIIIRLVVVFGLQIIIVRNIKPYI